MIMKNIFVVLMMFFSINVLAKAGEAYDIGKKGIIETSMSQADLQPDFDSCSLYVAGVLQNDLQVLHCNKSNLLTFLYKGEGCSTVATYFKNQLGGVILSQTRIGCDSFIDLGFAIGGVAIIKDFKE